MLTLAMRETANLKLTFHLAQRGADHWIMVRPRAKSRIGKLPAERATCLDAEMTPTQLASPAPRRGLSRIDAPSWRPDRVA
jgi:hypothetical protein